MKIAATGDWHITDKRPECRTDKDYLGTILNKITFILQFCKEMDVSLLIQPGDFFHSHRVPHEITGAIIYKLLFGRYRIPIVGVYGQHDLRFHSLDTSNTPLNVLESAGVFTRLHPDKPYTITTEQEHVCVWGCSWGESPEKIVPEPESTNILAIHRMIIDSEKLWPGQTDYTLAHNLMRNAKCNLIVSGDNHNPFMSQHVDKKLVNCGSLMRMAVNQVKHVPHFYIYDTITGDIKKYLIPVKKAETVIKAEKADYKKAASKELEDFVSRIGSSVDIAMDFKRNVMTVLEDMKAEMGLVKEVVSIFDSVESTSEWEEKQVLKRYNIAIDEEIDNGGGEGTETIGKIKRFHRGRQEGKGSVRGGAQRADEVLEE